MFKTTALIGLGLCILVLSGCAPKIDGSSAKAYESSLVRVASALDRDKKVIFNKALDIVSSHTPPTKELSAEANKRVSLADKTAEQIIEEATKIAVDELDKLKLEEKDNTKISGKDVLANTSIRVLSIQKGEDYLYAHMKYDAVIEITNKNNFDVDGIIAEVRGVDNSGSSRGWYGVIGFGRKGLQGVVSSGATRKAHVYILNKEDLHDDSFFTDDDDWFRTKLGWRGSNRPTMNNLSVKVTPYKVYAGDQIYYDDMKKQLPADIDQFLTLIKHKR